MSVAQIVGLAAEIVAVALVGILLDRWLGDVPAVIGLVICLALVAWFHRAQLKSLIAKQSSTVQTKSQQQELPVLPPPPTSGSPQASSAIPKQSPPRKLQPTAPIAKRHVYDLDDDDRRKGFEKALKEEKDQKQKIKIACDNSDESSCLAAGKFLLAISEAGWEIDSNQVFRMQQLIPKAGIAIASNDPNASQYKNLPPHQGFWHPFSPTEETFYFAFRNLGIPVYGTNDASLALGTIGIYFGPEP